MSNLTAPHFHFHPSRLSLWHLLSPVQTPEIKLLSCIYMQTFLTKFLSPAEPLLYLQPNALDG